MEIIMALPKQKEASGTRESYFPSDKKSIKKKNNNNVFLSQKHKNNTDHTANPLTCSVTKQSHHSYTCSQVTQDIWKTM